LRERDSERDRERERHRERQRERERERVIERETDSETQALHSQMSHNDMFRCDLLGALMKSCKKNAKCGVWVKFARVPLVDVIDICPALDAAHERKSGTGALVREAGFDFTAFRLFHQWIDHGYGVCSVDARGDAWFVIGAALRHVDPGATRITPPYVFLTVEVSLLFCYVYRVTVISQTIHTRDCNNTLIPICGVTL
jgi:hypothetical protein